MQVCCPEDIFIPTKTITGDDTVVRGGQEDIGDDEGSIWDFPTEPPKTSIRHSSNDYYDYYDENLYEEAFDKETEESLDFDNEEYYGHKCSAGKACLVLEQCGEEGDLIFLIFLLIAHNDKTRRFYSSLYLTFS